MTPVPTSRIKQKESGRASEVIPVIEIIRHHVHKRLTDGASETEVAEELDFLLWVLEQATARTTD
jgi:hypothetical protein